MGGRDGNKGLPERTSAYVLDQLLAGGLLRSPRSSLEKSEHARLASNAAASTSSVPAPVQQLATLPLSPRSFIPDPPAVLSAADLDGPMPLTSAFAAAPEPLESVFSRAEEPPMSRLNFPRASTDPARSKGLLPSAFASVAYADRFAPAPWNPVPEPERPPAPAVDLHDIEMSLPNISAQHACPCNTQVSINPTLWRHFERPFRLMVHLGIHTSLVEGEVTLPLGIYSSLNPRVVTTGKRHQIYIFWPIDLRDALRSVSVGLSVCLQGLQSHP